MPAPSRAGATCSVEYLRSSNAAAWSSALSVSAALSQKSRTLGSPIKRAPERALEPEAPGTRRVTSKQNNQVVRIRSVDSDTPIASLDLTVIHAVNIYLIVVL